MHRKSPLEEVLLKEERNAYAKIAYRPTNSLKNYVTDRQWIGCEK